MMKIERVTILGAGVMGGAIAQVLAVSGLEVCSYDPKDQVREGLRDLIAGGRFGLQRAVAKGALSEADAAAALDRVTVSADMAEAVSAADLVIEAVPELLALKLKVFADLDRLAPGEAILASNSSGFSIAALAAVTRRHDRVIGWHWSSPAQRMRMAEIVRTNRTSEEVIATVRDLALRAGKNPVVVNDTDQEWGYVANRVYRGMIREAEQVVREGIVDVEGLNQLMVDCFGFPVGPLAMIKGATSGWKDEDSAK